MQLRFFKVKTLLNNAFNFKITSEVFKPQAKANFVVVVVVLA